MNWFVAKMIFQIISDHNNCIQFDEQLRLIEAVDKHLALEIAYQIGFIVQEELKSNHNENTKLKFIAVTELEHIGEIANGKEIHYQLSKPEEVNSYLEIISLKATGLKQLKRLF